MRFYYFLANENMEKLQNIYNNNDKHKNNIKAILLLTIIQKLYLFTNFVISVKEKRSRLSREQNNSFYKDLFYS